MFVPTNRTTQHKLLVGMQTKNNEIGSKQTAIRNTFLRQDELASAREFTASFVLVVDRSRCLCGVWRGLHCLESVVH